jgi:hypothetical protein
LVEVIARDTREEIESSMSEIRTLTDALTHELRLVAELPGRRTISQSLPGARSGAKAAKATATSVLKAITPLAEALHPPAPPLAPPEVLLIEDDLNLEPLLKVLRWFLDDDEVVQAMGLSDREAGDGLLPATLDKARERLNAARDRATRRTLIVVTDRRVLTAESDAFLEEGAINTDIPLGQIRYVRCKVAHLREGPSLVDLITRDADLHLRFPAAASTQVKALVSLLAHAMNLPDSERIALLEVKSGEEPRQIAPTDEPSGSAASGVDTHVDE